MAGQWLRRAARTRTAPRRGTAGVALLALLLASLPEAVATSAESAYNAPASRLAITEVNLSAWTSEVQITDVTGGSVVAGCYYTGTTKRGPFTLWSNATGVAGSSTLIANVVARLADLDPGFSYAITSGALELLTQDTGHLIQAAVRTTNTGYDGRNSRTFPALAFDATNTAVSGGRRLLIPNLSNDGGYRPSVVLFNTVAAAAEVQVQVYDAIGNLLWSVPRHLGPLEMHVIADDLRPPKAPLYRNATVLVAVTSGQGAVMASGQTAHNVTQDPAAHLAVQGQPETTYANSPEPRKIITEVNWTVPWVSEVTIVDVTGGSTVDVWYDCGTDRRGPFRLWTNSGGMAYSSMTFANILQAIAAMDGGTYQGTSGALELCTQDGEHLIHAAVRTHNGVGHSRTFPALGEHPANTVAAGQAVVVPNLSNHPDYRCSVVLFNPTPVPVPAVVQVLASSGSPVVVVPRILMPYEMNVIADELRLPAAPPYSNATVRIDVPEAADSGYLLATGQTANNYSNDPAAHFAVQNQ